jgi:2-methylcitrate dehydratase PrpD
MMRCIDFPAMVKDGATYGAHVGVTAALLAARGFTGAPAETVELEAGRDVWSDLGARWRMSEQYLKPWPVCRWAQPAIEAAAQIRDSIGGRPIACVTVESFEAATRLSAQRPETTEAAQYSLPFPLAAMLVHGRVDARTVTDGLRDEAVLALAERIEMKVCRTLDGAFPARRAARLSVVLEDGSVIETGAVEARGEPEAPLSDTDLIEKFLDLADPVAGRARALSIAETVARIERLPEVEPLIDLVTASGLE